MLSGTVWFGSSLGCLAGGSGFIVIMTPGDICCPGEGTRRRRQGRQWQGVEGPAGPLFQSGPFQEGVVAEVLPTLGVLLQYDGSFLL